MRKRYFFSRLARAAFVSIMLVAISFGKPPSEADLLHELPNGKYLVTKMVKNAISDGKTVFVGTENNRPAPPGPMRLMVYDHKTEKYSELLTAPEIKALIHPYESFAFQEMAIDLNQSLLVIDIVSKFDAATGKTATALLFIDLKNKKKIHELSDSRFHEDIRLSPGGRYLAFRSNPEKWYNEPNNYFISANRVDLFDLKTKRLQTLSPDFEGLSTGSFYWANDASFLLFCSPEGNLPAGREYLQKWTAASGTIEKYELKDTDRFLGDLHLFPDGRILCVTSHDVFMLDTHLRFLKHIFKGKGLRLRGVEGNKVKFYDQEGKPGMGVLKEVPINP